MMRIICDTNIWYNIANGSIKPEQFKNHELISTYINLQELGSSENLLHNSIMVQNAMKCLLIYSNGIILESPIDYMLKVGNNQSGLENIEGKEFLRQIETLCGMQAIDFEKKVKSKEFKECIENYDKALQQSVDFINENKSKIASKIKSNNRKKEHWKADRAKDIIRIFAKMIQLHLNEKVKFENFNWPEFDLAIFLFDEYFKLLELTETQFSKNDWYDLFNLLYVQPDDKYFTCENKTWARILKTHIRTKKYCFDIECPDP